MGCACVVSSLMHRVSWAAWSLELPKMMLMQGRTLWCSVRTLGTLRCSVRILGQACRCSISTKLKIRCNFLWSSQMFTWRYVFMISAVITYWCCRKRNTIENRVCWMVYHSKRVPLEEYHSMIFPKIFSLMHRKLHETCADLLQCQQLWNVMCYSGLVIIHVDCRHMVEYSVINFT